VVDAGRRPCKTGDTVLVQGTGGVALFALQFAKLAGARVIAISSSDEKLERAKQLGADLGINYRTTPDWHTAVRAATGGRGVDIVVETAGATLDKSLAALAFGGFVGVVGFVAGYKAEIPIRALLGPMIRVQGIAVGSRARFEAMNRAIALHRLRPVIDSTFALGRRRGCVPAHEERRAFREGCRHAVSGRSACFASA
jgi:NADPH:quinone reductase-like Zn-dependent oxidoreductase